MRERILCQEMPSPPATVDVTPPKPNPLLTTRERFAQHEKDPYCAGCHRLMDPIGLGFESYDAIGRFRTKEGSLNIDASSALKRANRHLDRVVDLMPNPFAIEPSVLPIRSLPRRGPQPQRARLRRSCIS